jgi:alkylated DNA repair dioxygenase AlkB
MTSTMAWQPALFGGGHVRLDQGFASVRRLWLDSTAWLDVAPDWLRGADELFRVVLTKTDWHSREVRMYERVLREPRLTHRWLPADGDPLPHPALAEIARSLSARYRVSFSQIGANLYRHGTDSVAWHGDRVARELPEAFVALVSLGAARPFRLRPKGGGRSVGLVPGPGDLVVMGGSCQRAWDHSVPKTKGVGPRISLQFRHAYPDG